MNIETVKRLATEAGVEWHESFEGEGCVNLEILQQFAIAVQAESEESMRASHGGANVFVPYYDWNCQWESVDASVSAGQECGDFSEGDEFKMVRITVGACTTYRIMGGKPVPVAVAFPEALQPTKGKG